MDYARTLQFKYSFDNRDEEARKLIAELKKTNLKYVAYDNVNYWLFKIQKTQGWTWDSIMHLVNSVHPAKYIFVQAIIENGVEYTI